MADVGALAVEIVKTFGAPGQERALTEKLTALTEAAAKAERSRALDIVRDRMAATREAMARCDYADELARGELVTLALEIVETDVARGAILAGLSGPAAPPATRSPSEP